MRGTFPDCSHPAAIRPARSQRIPSARRTAGVHAAAAGALLRCLLLPAPTKVP